VGYVSSVLKQLGHNVDVLDINALRLDKETVARYLISTCSKYDYYGISGIVTTYAYQKWLIESIRSVSNYPIICGGGCASTAGRLLLEAGATKVIEGEGENSILSYFGSVFRYSNINEFPMPDWENINMETYVENRIWGKETGNASNVGIHKDMENIRRNACVITSRGCPYNCSFCYDLFGCNYRQRNVVSVIKEIKLLKENYNVDFIGFIDDNMFVDKRWVLSFCDEMRKLDLLWGCHARVNEVNEEILESAYNSGCRWIGYGIESGSQTMLNKMNKKTTVRHARTAIELTRKYDIYPNTSFIYGFPGENKATVSETVRFCKDLDLKPSFFHSIPYPGSKLYKDNEIQILNKFGGYENFIMQLGEAKDFVINLSGMPDKQYFKLKENMEKELQ